MWKQRGKSHHGDFLEPTVHTGLDPQARDALEREATSPVLLWAGGKKYQKQMPSGVPRRMDWPGKLVPLGDNKDEQKI